jgi:hypothetical protein
MVSTTSISSLGSLRPFIERAFRTSQAHKTASPEVPASCAAPLSEPARPSREGGAPQSR